MKKFIPALCAAALLSPAVFADGAANLVKNGGFEEDNAEWKIWGTHKHFTAEDCAAMLEIVTDNIHSGQKAVRSADVWEDGAPYLLQFIKLPGQIKVSDSFKLTFWAKAPKDAKFRAGLQMLTKAGDNEFGKWLGARNIEFTGTGELKEYTTTFERIYYPATSIGLFLAPAGSAKTDTGEVWFDDVTLTMNAQQ